MTHVALRFAAGLHRMLLGVYPAHFRRRFAADMQRVFESRLASASRRSAGAAVWFAVLECADVMWGGALERFAPVTPNPKTGRSLMVWQETMADVRFALRLMRRSPMFTTLAMGALALGIGATSAIFTAVDAVLLRPLPYARPADLVMVWSNNTHEHRASNPVSPADYVDLRTRTQSLAGLEAAQSFFTPEQFQDGAGDP